MDILEVGTFSEFHEAVQSFGKRIVVFRGQRCPDWDLKLAVFESSKMAKRTIKPAAGASRVSIQEATSAARVVYRDSNTGHFVILERERSSRSPKRREKSDSDRTISKDVGKHRKDSSSTSESRTYNIKKR